ncbi:hypothetical protein CA13_63280 [Planctomycetes bacterium CA13]|uniref:Uncharacterized protein n=1 Tax=Novipirellula herctigrandis TaxID=2527986 RepID=A0A5C5ZCQ8_9BACT|nr:hypothetical protein CA13_63280 [Planctomycetes bacterium CA13]
MLRYWWDRWGCQGGEVTFAFCVRYSHGNKCLNIILRLPRPRVQPFHPQFPYRNSLLRKMVQPKRVRRSGCQGAAN